MMNKQRILLATLIIFTLTFPLIGVPTDTGIDNSYMWAFNYFFDKGVRIGKEIIFTFGPLGFLLFPQPIGNNLIIGIVIQSLLRLIFIWSLFALASRRRDVKKPQNKIITFILVFLMANFIDFGFLLVFTTGVSLFLLKETKKRIFLIIGAAICALALLTKANYGIASAVLIISFAFLHRANFGLVFLSVPVFFFLFWFLLYRDLAGVPNFLLGLWEISKGYSSSMTANVENNSILLGLFVILFFSLPFLFRSSRILFLYGIFLLSSIVVWRETFLREDDLHTRYFFDFVLLFYLLLLLYTPKIKVQIILLMFVSLLLFGGNMQNLQRFGDPDYFKKAVNQLIRTDGLVNFRNILSGYNTYKEKLKKSSQDNLKKSTLSPNIRNLIGNQTIDTYPWEISYIPANNLNWRSRPVIQSYAALTPWLDRQNALFFSSPYSPEFILWHRDKWGGEMESIDGRYLLNDEPETITAIFNYYKLIVRDEKLALFQKRRKPVFKEAIIIGRQKANWEEWIEVPRVKSGVIKVRIKFSRQLLGVVKKLIWKENYTYIEYEFEVKERQSRLIYRLVVDNMPNGIWINPFLSFLSPEFQGEEVRQIRITHDQNDFFKKEVNLVWVFYPFD